MSGCIYKLEDGRCDKPGRYLSPCIGEACTHQTPSNYDRIVSMPPEELSEWIGNAECPRKKCFLADDCVACWLDWLKSPAKEGEG